VLNGVSPVSEATRARVVDSMEQLGYQPNSAARALVTSRTRNIGVIGVEPGLFGPTQDLLGLLRAADAAGYGLSITHVRDLSRTATEKAGIRFADQSVDGILLVEPVHAASRSILAKANASGDPGAFHAQGTAERDVRQHGRRPHGSGTPPQARS
jgi:DNA-binding LacI/PurR family transcriptional regulator